MKLVCHIEPDNELEEKLCNALETLLKADAEKATVQAEMETIAEAEENVSLDSESEKDQEDQEDQEGQEGESGETQPFTAKFKRIVKAKGITLVEVGEALGVSSSTPGHILRKANRAETNYFQRLCNAIGCDVEIIIKDRETGEIW